MLLPSAGFGAAQRVFALAHPDEPAGAFPNFSDVPAGAHDAEIRPAAEGEGGSTVQARCDGPVDTLLTHLEHGLGPAGFVVGAGHRGGSRR